MALRPTALLDAASYGFEWLRLLPELSLQEGVLGPRDFEVTVAAAGGLRVDVAAGTALVKGDSGSPGTGLTHGLYPQINDAAIPNAVTLPAADGTLPRIDQIVLQINDSTDLGSAGNVPALTYAAGIPTTGATLNNRSGAAALPANALLLADILIPAGATAVTADNVRDRRAHARGFLGRARGTTSSPISNARSPAAIPDMSIAGNFSGAPIIVEFTGQLTHDTAGGDILIEPSIDGGGAALHNVVGVDVTAAGQHVAINAHALIVPAAGYHTIYMRWSTPSGTMTAFGVRRRMTVREDVRVLGTA